jgi:hypothetical protein
MKIKVDTRDELLTRILDAPTRLEQRDSQLRRKIYDFRLGVAKCIAVDGGIFEHFFNSNKIEIYVNCNFSLIVTIYNACVFVDSKNLYLVKCSELDAFK